MKHIKLYENWLNEAQGVKLDAILLDALSKTKYVTDANLVALSKFGKTFESQIRKNLDSFRQKYASNSVWNNLNSKEGIDAAIGNFKELFFAAHGGNAQVRNSPLTAFGVKINNALDYTEDDFFSGITLDNELWRSNAAVELKDIIVNGNENMARGLAASIILLDLGVAITNGMYFMSNSITLGRWVNQENVNLGNLLNTTLTGKFSEAKELLNWGRNFVDFYKLKDVYTHPYNNSIKPDWKRFQTVSNFEEFVPYVKKMSFDYLTETIQWSDGGVNMPPPGFFAPIFVASYMSDGANTAIAMATDFMKAGGPSLLQTGISKFKV